MTSLMHPGLPIRTISNQANGGFADMHIGQCALSELGSSAFRYVDTEYRDVLAVRVETIGRHAQRASDDMKVGKAVDRHELQSEGVERSHSHSPRQYCPGNDQGLQLHHTATEKCSRAHAVGVAPYFYGGTILCPASDTSSDDPALSAKSTPHQFQTRLAARGAWS